jgi:hypothetical protein
VNDHTRYPGAEGVQETCSHDIVGASAVRVEATLVGSLEQSQKDAERRKPLRLRQLRVEALLHHLQDHHRIVDIVVIVDIARCGEERESSEGNDFLGLT